MTFKKTIRDVDVRNQRVLVRVDYNVSLNESGQVRDDTRIQETVETLNYLRANQARIILMSHLGRPEGRPNSKYSLRPVVGPLEKLLSCPVKFAEDCVGPKVHDMASSLLPGEFLLLENLRFHPEEEKNDETFARSLASLGDLFVQEAFGTVHRVHASIVGIPRFLPAYAGFLVEKEYSYLSHLLHDSKPPFYLVLGGAKASTKLGVLENLLSKVDKALIGGGMAFTFLKAEQYFVGNSLVEEAFLPKVSQLLKRYSSKLMFPIDVLAAPSLQAVDQIKQVKLSKSEDLMQGLQGLDVGQETITRYLEFLTKNRPGTLFWNGPMGVFEVPEFSEGTLAIAKSLGQLVKQGSTIVVGGGDSIAALNQLGLAKAMTHISTGGGASLELLEGMTLPGIAALRDAEPVPQK